jgi:hypothetical protein
MTASDKGAGKQSEQEIEIARPRAATFGVRKKFEKES